MPEDNDAEKSSARSGNLDDHQDGYVGFDKVTKEHGEFMGIYIQSKSDNTLTYLTAKQALSLLDWLRREEETLKLPTSQEE